MSNQTDTKMLYNITPEEMWNCRNSDGGNWGIEGYKPPRKYFDYNYEKWKKEREEIKNGKKKAEWPPKDWPKPKGDDKAVPPKRLNFIDEAVKLANSFNDPVKSKELYDSLSPKGIFEPKKPKEIRDVRSDFLDHEKKENERKAALPKVQEWKQAAIEAAGQKVVEFEKSKKTQTEKNISRYTKDKPLWSRCDRVTIMADSEHIGEQIPFYNSYAKEGAKPESLFFPKKVFHRAPVWSFDHKNRLNGQNEQMKAREANFTEKVSNYLSSKNLKESDIQIDIQKSIDMLSKRGRYKLSINKPFDYANTEQYKKAREEHPSFSPGPQEYWKMKPNTIDCNKKPEAPETVNIRGKDAKVYYLNRRRTDHILSKPMRASVF